MSLQTIGTKPIAHIDHFAAEMLGAAEMAEEVHLDGSGKLIKVRGRPASGKLIPLNASFTKMGAGGGNVLRSPAAPTPARR